MGREGGERRGGGGGGVCVRACVCVGAGGGVVVVVVRTWSLRCVIVHTYQQLASNYGSRAPVNTAPGPVPVCRA